MGKPKGHAGSWFAEWNGEKLPCVHQHWMKDDRYNDPGFDGRAKWDRFVAALKTGKKALLTTSHPLDKNGKRRRKSYVGVYRVDGVEAGNGRLRFRFTEQLNRF